MEDNEKERFTSYLPKRLIKEIRELSDTTGVPQSRILENGMDEYLDKIKNDISLIYTKKNG